MKFKTPSWDDSAEAWAEFFRASSQHLEGLRDALPARVLELARLPGIDDGLIVETVHDRAERVLRLTLLCGDLQMGYYDLKLIYEDADITPEHAQRLARLAHDTPSEHGPEVSRHEVDVTKNGQIEHRIEFHDKEPDSWFAIRCSALTWETARRPDRGILTPFARFSGGADAATE